MSKRIGANSPGSAQEIGQVILDDVARIAQQCVDLVKGSPRAEAAFEKDAEILYRAIVAVGSTLAREMGASSSGGAKPSESDGTSQHAIAATQAVEMCGIVRRAILSHLHARGGQLGLEQILLVSATVDSEVASAFAALPAVPESESKESVRILLAEDTKATRQLLLTAFDRTKYQIDVAENGEEAVELFQHGYYDLVLTDVHMPVLDGISAAKQIRNLEARDPQRRRTPIVAITAGTLQNERQACREAGMDAFFAKPIDLPRLFSLIRRVTRKDGYEPEGLTCEEDVTKVEVHQKAHLGHSLIDLQRSLSRLRGNLALFQQLVVIFIEDQPQLVDQMRQAALSNDLATLTRTAHTLKGMAANFDAQSVVQAAAALEEMARAGKVEEVRQAIPSFEEQVSLLLNELQQYQETA